MPENPRTPHDPTHRDQSRTNTKSAPGVNDDPPGPDRLWAPWRLAYLESLPADDAPPPPGAAPGASSAPAPAAASSGSFLADYWSAPISDQANHIVERTSEGLILLTKYPSANGHLLVALGCARPRLLDYEPHQRAALWALVDRACAILERALEPQGVNIGVNQGRAAGAGVPSHLHVHLVPRWGGDVNFMTAVGSVRVIPGSLDAMFARMQHARRTLDADLTP